MSKSTTFAIYRIVCFPTAQIYVGLTAYLHVRRGAHFNRLKAGTHHNRHLQAAYKKYGAEMFYFEVLEKDISENLIDERERYWIAHFDSYHHGFNMTEGGEGRYGHGTPCIWEGIEYPSITEAARANDMPRYLMKWRIGHGYHSESEVPPYIRRTCVWNGIEYPSIRAAAKANGMSESGMKNRIYRGHTSDTDVRSVSREITYNGIVYPSLSAAARANEISVAGMWDRIQRGYLKDTDIPPQYRNRLKKKTR